MSFKDSLKKVYESSLFKHFKEKHKDAFLFSSYFTLNPDLTIESRQVDFYIPSKKKVETFFIEEDKIKHKIDEFKAKNKITKLDDDIKIDIPEVINIIKKEIEKQKLSAFKISKIIVILQKQEDKQIWNITCLFDSFKMLRLHIDSIKGDILESKQGSILDFIQIRQNK